jgi:hypothetical protein
MTTSKHTTILRTELDILEADIHSVKALIKEIEKDYVRVHNLLLPEESDVQPGQS